LLFCGNVFSQNESDYSKYDSLKRGYQVLAIQKNNKFYLINVVDSKDYKFTIVSTKYKELRGRKIEVGKKYDLLLYSIYPPPEDGIILVGGNVIHHDFFVDGIRIKFHGDFDTGFLVTSPDLRGIYYVGDREDNGENSYAAPCGRWRKLRDGRTEAILREQGQ
jgi:hypothetical protein